MNPVIQSANAIKDYVDNAKSRASEGSHLIPKRLVCIGSGENQHLECWEKNWTLPFKCFAALFRGGPSFSFSKITECYCNNEHALKNEDFEKTIRTYYYGEKRHQDSFKQLPSDTRKKVENIGRETGVVKAQATPSGKVAVKKAQGLPNPDTLPCLKRPSVLPKSNYLLPNIVVGGYPGSPKVDQMIKMQRALVAAEGVTHILCLMPTDELEGRTNKKPFTPYEETAKALHPSVVCRQILEIPDQWVLDDERIKPAIDELIKIAENPENKLYIHCHGGNGRTSTITTILLSKMYKIPLEAALTHVYKAYLNREYPVLPFLPENEMQFETMKRLCNPPQSTLTFDDWVARCEELHTTIRPELRVRGSELHLDSDSFAKLTDAQLGKIVQTAPVGTIRRYRANLELFNRLMGTQGVYQSRCCIALNASNVQKYMTSDDCVRHQKSVKVYYDAKLDQKVAMKMATEREPVNIAQNRLYDEGRAKDLLGCSRSYFERSKNDKTTGTPVTSVYSETFWWNPPGTPDKPKELAVLNVYAPALDSKAQPHAADYVDLKTMDLKEDVYKEHMRKMAETIVQAAVDNRRSAFQEKGIKRIVIPLVGQANFVAILNSAAKEKAFAIFEETLADALKSHAEELKGLEIVMSEYQGSRGQDAAEHINSKIAGCGLTLGAIIGDIGINAEEQDLIVNAWDPHSAPGNGNDGDNSFDGQVGRRTGVLLSATSWFNPLMRDPSIYRAV